MTTLPTVVLSPVLYSLASRILRSPNPAAKTSGKSGEAERKALLARLFGMIRKVWPLSKQGRRNKCAGMRWFIKYFSSIILNAMRIFLTRVEVSTLKTAKNLRFAVNAR